MSTSNLVPVGAPLRLLNLLSSLALAVGCIATLLMMIHVSVAVVGRLVFHEAVGGTLETVTYIYMVAVVFLPLAAVQRRREQIIVEVFSHMLPKRQLAVLDGLVGILGCAFMLTLTWFSAHEAWAQTMIRETAPSTANPVPIWPARWLVVLGSGLTAIYLGVQTVIDLTLAISGRVARFDERIDHDAARGAEL